MMDILVNGESLALEASSGATLGEILSQADTLVEKAGAIIVGIKVDGKELGPEGYGEAAKRAADTVVSLDIRAESARDVRMRTIATLLELAQLAARAAAADETVPDDWRALREGASDIRDAFGGLFAEDELAFVKLLAEALDAAGDEPAAAARSLVAAQASRIASFFGERQAELGDPAAEMRAASALFESRSRELADLPVLLQTGREAEAMKSVLFFIELFNKVVRVMPELGRAGVDAESLRIGDSSVAEFYGQFNAVLRELGEAFEHKDAILIGDLAEYEILPRMRLFFTAMDGALSS